jgi:ABC-type Co2+ transport system permease subunit
MHIPDNYLGPATCAILAAAMVPVRTVSIRKAQAGLEGGFEKSRKGRHCFVLPQ